MSVYRPRNSPFYQYDFQWRGRRFFGSTKRTNRREAEAVERAKRESAKKETAASQAALTSLQLDHVVGRYWMEVGQYHAGADNTWRDLCRLVDRLGKTKLLTEITDNDVSRLVAWRRSHRVVRSKSADAATCPPIANATVNRSVTELLRKLFTRARTAWGVQFEQEPNWRSQMLPEPQERMRELVGDEDDRLVEATRADYLPFFAFAKASGFRMRECLLRWSEVDWEAGQIRKRGKGNKLVTVPITPTIHAILSPLRGHDPKYVFTYVAQRTRGGHVKGHRYPLTYSGVKTAWRRLRERAGVEDFRFHDFRHDLATKVLRKTGNLKLVQRLLNHSDMKTTARYAHVLDLEVAGALESVTKSRNKSRTAARKLA